MTARTSRMTGPGATVRRAGAWAALLAGVLAALPWTGLHAQSQDDLLPVEQAFRLQRQALADGRIRLDWEIAPDYYLYRERIKVRAVDPGVEPGEPVLPPGIEKHDEFFGEVQIYRSRAEATLAPRIVDAAAGTRIAVTVQGCHEVDPLICYPPHTTTFHVGSDPAAAGGDVAAALIDDTGASTAATAATGAAPSRQSPPAGAGGALSPGAIALALLLALAGGLVLNLMPCVLPVLSLKVLSLAQVGADRREARVRALWYTAGSLTGFSALGLLVIALRHAGLGLGWGFQLQQPLAVGVLAYVMFALGLSLSGVVVFGSRLAGVGEGLARRSGAAGDFFTGVLAVVVASPCTAPFMGVALTVALASSAWLALSIFLLLGLGLALPFLLVGLVPALSSRLPRPGAWMETLKQFLAFPLYATAAWLAWVLTRQRGADALAWLLAGLLLLALGLWLGERLRYGRRAWLRVAAWPIVALAAWPLWQLHRAPAAPAATGVFAAADGSVRYSPAQLQQLRDEGRTVFVNITADWCVTCKANERRLFSGAAFRDALAANGAVYVKGDWTNVDPEITRFLQSHGAVGVPLYVVYRPGAQGRVLPVVPTRAQVEAVLKGESS